MRRTSTLSTSALIHPRSVLTKVASMAALVVVSIFLGAFGTYTASQFDDHLERELQLERAQMELEMSALRVEFIRSTYDEHKRRYEMGMASSRETLHYEGELRKSELHLHGAEINLQEVQLSGKEPNDSLSAPLVEGKDFVRDRTRIRLQGAEIALDVARRAYDEAKKLYQMGAQSDRELHELEAQVKRVEQHIHVIKTQLELREKFVAGELSANRVELVARRAEARGRLMELEAELNAVMKQFDHTKRLVESGLASTTEMHGLEFHLRGLEMQLALAKKELSIIERQIKLDDEKKAAAEGGG